MRGLAGPVRALIDSGSEVNLMSRKLFEKGKWAVDRQCRWAVNSVNQGKMMLWGGCPNVPVRFGNVEENLNIFVHEALSFDLLLGTPFITELRLSTQVLKDGTHMAKVQSKDGLRIVQFPTVLPDHERNRSALREAPIAESENFLGS